MTKMTAPEKYLLFSHSILIYHLDDIKMNTGFCILAHFQERFSGMMQAVFLKYLAVLCIHTLTCSLILINTENTQRMRVRTKEYLSSTTTKKRSSKYQNRK